MIDGTRNIVKATEAAGVRRFIGLAKRRFWNSISDFGHGDGLVEIDLSSS